MNNQKIKNPRSTSAVRCKSGRFPFNCVIYSIAVCLISLGVTESSDAYDMEVRLTSPDPTEGGWFGYSVALSGNRALIGDQGDGPRGAAHVVEPGSSLGDWRYVSKLAPPSADQVSVGNAVDIDNNTAIVGGRLFESTAPGANDGVAYFFERSADGAWTGTASQQFAGTRSERQSTADDRVAIHGDVAVVGARWDDSNAIHAGSAYVFERNLGGPNAWGLAAKLVPSDLTSEDSFGTSVDVWGDRIVVGAPTQGEFYQGALYVFELTGSSWQQTAKLVSPNPASGGIFGWSASLYEDRVLVGAVRESNPGGAAYIFNNDGGVWELEASFFGQTGSSSEFGKSVALTADSAAIGEPFGPFTPAGPEAAYVFQEVADRDWRLVKKLMGSDSVPGDMFGNSVAISDSGVLVGAFLNRKNGYQSGAAYLFVPELSSSTLLIQIAATLAVPVWSHAKRRRLNAAQVDN